jgi:hypothetical protein
MSAATSQNRFKTEIDMARFVRVSSLLFDHKLMGVGRRLKNMRRDVAAR